MTKTFLKKIDPAVDSLTLSVDNGKIVGFFGLNAPPKRLPVRDAVRATLLTAGTVAINGKDIVGDKAEASRLLGWVPELPNFEPNTKASSLLRTLQDFAGQAEARPNNVAQRCSRKSLSKVRKGKGCATTLRG